jgi:hypothetical protein
LTTSAIAANTKYKLTVSNVAALSGNTSPTGLQAYFTAGTTGTGLQGQYYDNIDFTSLKVTRTDATVNFNFGSGSPDPSIGADTFSVRWAGLVRPTTTAVYTFYTTSDDGVRLYVNGQLLISDWTDHGPTEDSGSISLVAGQKYDLRMEYYENSGGAVATLSWSSPTITKAIIPQSALFAPATIAIADVSQGEGNSGLTYQEFVVSLSNPVGSDVTMAYSTSPGTATAGSDYTAVSGVLTIPAGVTAKAIVVPIVGDATSEQNETFNVTLSSPSSLSFSDSAAIGTILNDDAVPSLSISDVSINEGNSGSTNAVFTVTLSSSSIQQITVNYATADGTATAGADYTSTSGMLTFAPGTISMPVVVPVQGDTLSEVNEQFSVNLSGAVNATIADGQGVGTIVNDDPLPSFSIGNVSLTEGDSGQKTAIFTVTLSTASGQTVTVGYGTTDASATAGSDYLATSGMLTFTAGQTSQTIPVTVNGDTTFEPDENFTVTLSSPTAATLATSSATGTILNDDIALIPTASMTPLNPSTVTAGPNQLTIVWNEAVSGFAISSLSLTRGGGPNLLTPAQTLTTSDHITFTLNNLSSLDVRGGDYTLKYTAAGSNVVDGSNQPAVADASTTFTVLPVAPEVNAVYVSGTAWQQGFLNYLANNSLGDSQLGYRLTGGPNQLNSLPWTSVDTVSIVFSRDVNIATANLALVGSPDLAAAPALSTATFSYNSTTHVASWVYHSSLPLNKYLLSIPAASVTSVASGQTLDGEFVNGSGALLPSGDAVAGGDFNFRFNVLPGDVDQNGAVNSLDGANVRLHLLQYPNMAGYNPLFDTLGKGAITGIDLMAVQNALFSALPNTEPPPPGQGGGGGGALTSAAPAMDPVPSNAPSTPPTAAGSASAQGSSSSASSSATNSVGGSSDAFQAVAPNPAVVIGGTGHSVDLGAGSGSGVAVKSESSTSLAVTPGCQASNSAASTSSIDIKSSSAALNAGLTTFTSGTSTTADEFRAGSLTARDAVFAELDADIPLAVLWRRFDRNRHVGPAF